ncbi:MAG: hypothetical protein H7X86_13230 [Gorillibacterium sp.]|nr:hypothetical protein [Gorillibacterium sp.]
MANIQIIDERTIRISVKLEDAITMINEAARELSSYAADIVTIYEKMPVFDYIHFCFYAYDSAALFEFMLETDPKKYTSFSLDAPDSFFYTLYGGMAGLYPAAKQRLELIQA